MGNLSVVKPQNEPIVDYRKDDDAWKQLQAAFAGIPSEFEVPLVIGGRSIYTDEKIDSLDPATGRIFCRAQRGTPEHARAAVAAAREAKETWSRLPIETRVQKWRDLEWILHRRRYEIMAVASAECGFTPNELMGSWAEMMDFIRFNPYWLLRLSRERLGDGQHETNQMNLRPLKGFTAAVTPFNFPVAIGYNLPTVMALCGNTVVWKPSSDAPFTSWLLMKAIEDAGFPPGVINMVTGAGSTVMKPVLDHPELTAVNFTGGVGTARYIASRLFGPELGRPHFPRFVAETGGKDFMVVDRDCDVWDVAACIVHGAFGRSGQKCSANSLVLADQHVWPELSAALVEQMRSFRVGDPRDRATDMGPVINVGAYESIVGYIERAKRDPRVKVLCGGEHSAEQGFWIQPTILEVDADEHELLREEIFGPVTAVRAVENAEQALRVIQNHPYRLTGAVWSRNELWLDRWVPIFSEYAGNFYVNRKTSGAVVDQQPFGGDGLSGTNYKAGGAWYLLQFLSQGSVTRRHWRYEKKLGVWGWR